METLQEILEGNRVAFCYGAGEYAFFVTLFLRAHQINVIGYIVSDNKMTAKTYLHRPVYAFSDAKKKGILNDLVLISLGRIAREEVKKIVKEDMIKGYFLYEEDMKYIFSYLYSLSKNDIEILLLDLLSPKQISFFKILYEKHANDISYWYQSIRPISEYECEYSELYNKYQCLPRYREISIHFCNKKIRIADVESFLCAYKAILVEKIYEFIPHNQDDVVILDFGANIGVSAFFFSKEYPQSKIFAFEPDPKIFDVLQHNMDVLQCGNVKLFNQAVWDEDKILQFLSEGADAGRIESRMKTDGVIQVKAIDAKKILDRQTHVDFLKIDIEGAETIVLKRIAGCWGKVHNIFVEYHSKVDENQSFAEVVAILDRAGFRVYLGEEGLRQPNPYKEIKSYSGFDGLINIFGVRKNDTRLFSNT